MDMDMDKDMDKDKDMDMEKDMDKDIHKDKDKQIWLGHKFYRTQTFTGPKKSCATNFFTGTQNFPDPFCSLLIKYFSQRQGQAQAKGQQT